MAVLIEISLLALVASAVAAYVTVVVIGKE